MWPIVKILSMLNWWIVPTSRAASQKYLRPRRRSAFQFVRLAVSQRPVLSGDTPADLITLTTPAAKPRRKNTISPQGDVDSKRSKPQPITAPTTTPAINSEESRKPRAIAEALAAPSPLSDPGWSVLVLRLSRISDKR